MLEGLYFHLTYPILTACLIGIFISRSVGQRFPVALGLALTLPFFGVASYISDVSFEKCSTEWCGTLGPRVLTEEYEGEASSLAFKIKRLQKIKPNEAPVGPYGTLRTFKDPELVSRLRDEFLTTYTTNLKRELENTRIALAQSQNHYRESAIIKSLSGAHYNFPLFQLWLMGYLLANGVGALAQRGLIAGKKLIDKKRASTEELP